MGVMLGICETPDRVTIIQIVLTDDSIGNSTESEEIVHNNIPCRIAELTSQERLINLQLQHKPRKNVYVNPITGVSTENFICRIDSIDYDIIDIYTYAGKYTKIFIEKK
jgi:hypothetical protein